MNKQDFLRECMSGFGIVPHDEFKKAYCLRCLNQDCTWSVGGTTSFVHRVQNWKEKLFTKVDRANDDDPNYEEVRAKKFLPMTPSLGNVNKGFVSPNMEPETIPAPAPEFGIVPEMELPTETDNNLEEEAPLTEPNLQEPLDLMDPKEDEETETEQEVPNLDNLDFSDETSPDVNVPDLDSPPIPEATQAKEEPEEANFGMVQNTNFQQGTMLGNAKEENVIPAGGTVILDDE